MDSEAPAVIQGTYSDYRRVKGRKMLQLIIEVPIEEAPRVHDAFGEPSPDGATWVAVALLNPEHAKLKQAFKDSVEVEKKGGRLARQCAMTCQEQSFKTFLQERGYMHSSTDPVEIVYDYCGIESRKELDHDESAASNWRMLEREYQAWMQV